MRARTRWLVAWVTVVMVLMGACTDPGILAPSPVNATVDCQDVPEELCHRYAESALAGPQPSGSGQIVSVTVTCEVKPPCESGRMGSGGQVIIEYNDGTSFSQDWILGSGV
jgi:hypothetical protein